MINNEPSRCMYDDINPAGVRMTASTKQVHMYDGMNQAVVRMTASTKQVYI